MKYIKLPNVLISISNNNHLNKTIIVPINVLVILYRMVIMAYLLIYGKGFLKLREKGPCCTSCSRCFVVFASRRSESQRTTGQAV